MNRRDLERRIVRLGGSVEPVRRHGENRYSHPAVPEKVKHNARRKSASRHAEVWLRRIESIMQRDHGLSETR